MPQDCDSVSWRHMQDKTIDGPLRSRGRWGEMHFKNCLGLLIQFSGEAGARVLELSVLQKVLDGGGLWLVSHISHMW